MRKLATFTILVLLVAVLAASSVSAAAMVKSFNFDMPGGLYSDTSATTYVTAGFWTVNCTGGTTLTATDTAAAINGTYGNGDVWKFIYHDSVNGWQTLTTLVGSTTAGPNIQTTTGNMASGPFTVYADAFAIGYSFNQVGANSASSGTAGMTATAVPEPSSLVALATGVVGILGFVRRRRS